MVAARVSGIAPEETHSFARLKQTADRFFYVDEIISGRSLWGLENTKGQRPKTGIYPYVLRSEKGIGQNSFWPEYRYL